MCYICGVGQLEQEPSSVLTPLKLSYDYDINFHIYQKNMFLLYIVEAFPEEIEPILTVAQPPGRVILQKNNKHTTTLMNI